MRFGALDRLVPTGALKTQEKCLKSECQSGKIRSCHRNEKARWRPNLVLSPRVCIVRRVQFPWLSSSHDGSDGVWWPASSQQ